jgi:hypothetical protein
MDVTVTKVWPDLIARGSTSSIFPEMDETAEPLALSGFDLPIVHRGPTPLLDKPAVAPDFRPPA